MKGNDGDLSQFMSRFLRSVTRSTDNILMHQQSLESVLCPSLTRTCENLTSHASGSTLEDSDPLLVRHVNGLLLISLDLSRRKYFKESLLALHRAGSIIPADSGFEFRALQSLLDSVLSNLMERILLDKDTELNLSECDIRTLLHMANRLSIESLTLHLRGWLALLHNTTPAPSCRARFRCTLMLLLVLSHGGCGSAQKGFNLCPLVWKYTRMFDIDLRSVTSARFSSSEIVLSHFLDTDIVCSSCIKIRRRYS